MANQTLLEDKKEPCLVSVSDLVSWFTRFPLVEHMFVAVVRACFIDLEGIIEKHPHGLAEGCEETVEHVHYERYVLWLPAMDPGFLLGGLKFWLGGFNCCSTEFQLLN